MKKLLSLVLALALCLSTVAAIADIPSKVVNTIVVSVNGEVCSETPAAEAEDAAKDELAKLVNEGPAAYFGSDVTDVYEFGPIKVTIPENATPDENGDVEAVFSVDFPFAEGENVVILLGVLNDDNTITWTRYEGIADGNGNVTAKVNADILANASYCAMGK